MATIIYIVLGLEELTIAHYFNMYSGNITLLGVDIREPIPRSSDLELKITL